MNTRVRHLLQKIKSLQSKGDVYFPAGIFPASRANRQVGYSRADTTIFFSSIICFTLQKLKEASDDRETLELIDEITSSIIVNYKDFQNKDGLETYNFWKTKPSRHFPNGYIFRHFEHFRIPDDVDDTAFVYLTSNRTTEDVEWLQQKLALHANGAKQWIRNTFQEVKNLPAYSTWFGKNMYIEFDACVLSNILYCLYQYGLQPDEHGLASLEYIRFVIDSGHYLTAPFRCAHQYPRTELIIYHVARLIAAFDPEPLRHLKSKLISDAQKILANTTSVMDKVILSTSLIKLGVETEHIDTEKIQKTDFKKFYFFIAGLLTAYENPILYKISRSKLFHMHWQCEAHCWTLIAEYEMAYQMNIKRFTPSGKV